ncbi:hypothetical protein DPMN_073934 [Dreissena polymorpha]|uniref:Uncharacterized protein n=1 Tax=Dreissena polymorpha TaxID=45954 RepID=A0A9D4BL37_DREPO|nr:hypothetical protein DPMN_073934 [Dreissena polymorpha]
MTTIQGNCIDPFIITFKFVLTGAQRLFEVTSRHRKLSPSPEEAAMDVKRVIAEELQMRPPRLPVWFRYDMHGSLYNDKCLKNQHYYFNRSEVTVLSSNIQVSTTLGRLYSQHIHIFKVLTT